MRWSMLAIGLAGTLVRPADAAVFCATKKGAVKLRDACKPKETVIDAAAVGIQGPQGPTGNTGDPGAAGLPGPGQVTFGATYEDIVLDGSYAPVAATNEADGPGTEGVSLGAVTATAPDTVILVNASVSTNAQSGTLACKIESSLNGGSYTTLSSTSSTTFDLFLGDSVYVFEEGRAYQFRLSCLVSGGSRTVTTARLGAVAGAR
jgi:hypothetical protein